MFFFFLLLLNRKGREAESIKTFVLSSTTKSSWWEMKVHRITQRSYVYKHGCAFLCVCMCVQQCTSVRVWVCVSVCRSVREADWMSCAPQTGDPDVSTTPPFPSTAFPPKRPEDVAVVVTPPHLSQHAPVCHCTPHRHYQDTVQFRITDCRASRGPCDHRKVPSRCTSSAHLQCRVCPKVQNKGNIKPTSQWPHIPFCLIASSIEIKQIGEKVEADQGQYQRVKNSESETGVGTSIGLNFVFSSFHTSFPC